ncbi:hypothetical protein B0I35DRAFT_248766 [Stachybotrys elegans]|uniref:Uncharacterized protein n=1 Tax=Stachybotrys elegans TaxID=80388 RepID=A0A8K0WRD0_9HYPO|nr:hypothetical protein B0I35DRAFT_248766 [Stachybotrys elegans]
MCTVTFMITSTRMDAHLRVMVLIQAIVDCGPQVCSSTLARPLTSSQSSVPLGKLADALDLATSKRKLASSSVPWLSTAPGTRPPCQRAPGLSLSLGSATRRGGTCAAFSRRSLSSLAFHGAWHTFPVPKSSYVGLSLSPRECSTSWWYVCCVVALVPQLLGLQSAWYTSRAEELPHRVVPILERVRRVVVCAASSCHFCRSGYRNRRRERCVGAKNEGPGHHLLCSSSSGFSGSPARYALVCSCTP